MAFLFGVICGFTGTFLIFYAIARKISKGRSNKMHRVEAVYNGGDDKYYDCK